MKLIPKNWASFQHYKDRNPPWIKLHKGLLNDRAYTRLPLASKALAPLLWLLASESKDGSFEAEVEELAFRLRMTEKEIAQGLDPLIKSGFFMPVQSDSTVLASGLQVAPKSCSERETEAETKREREAPAGAFDLPSWIPSETWAAYCKVRTGKKAKNEPHALGLIVKDLERFRSAGHDPVEVLNNSIKSGWAGVFEPKTKPGAQPIATTSADPDSRSAIEAEGVAKGIGPWNEVAEQWHLYKARVRGKQNGLDLTQLAAMAAQRGVH